MTESATQTERPVRTRIAPSPTGFPHVGTAYIALFNLCFAKAHGGEFILRIEDTDRARSTLQSEKLILDSLKWLGLNWSEGPDVGGPHAPYRQSERGDKYAEHADKLLKSGHAFRCFCDAQTLDTMREEQRAAGQTPRYDGRCMAIDPEVTKERAKTEAHVVRMKVPSGAGDEFSGGLEHCVIKDTLRGTVEYPWSQIDMQVLVKTDGMPTYHLASVVDDHLMQITHVIRGEEWLPSTPKHVLLYQYFGWDAPTFAHMPLLRNPDKSKLSKRKNPTSISFYKDMGYLPEALLNFLGRMGYSLPSDAERFTLDEMIQSFDISRVSLGGPIFEIDKLDWLNAQWIKELTPAELTSRLIAWAQGRTDQPKAAAAITPRISKFSDAIDWLRPYYMGLPAVTAEDFAHKSLTPEQVLEHFQLAVWRLEALGEWSEESVKGALMGLAGALEVKLRDFIAPFFVAMSGSSSSVPVMNLMADTGADMTLARLRHAVEALGGIGKKKLKSLEKRYQDLSV